MKLLVDNKQIAKYIGMTPRNVNLSYESQSQKQNHYLCLQVGTLLNLRGIGISDFLSFINVYDSLQTKEIERLKSIEAKYNKIIGIANE